MWILKLDEHGNADKDVGISGSGSDHASPGGFSLSQNYPNPFNPSTRIRFHLPRSSFVLLTAYNLLGQEIETLVRGWYPAGAFEVDWTPEDLSSGTYVYRLQTGGWAATRRSILQR
jgi:hypothetical protein